MTQDRTADTAAAAAGRAGRPVRRAGPVLPPARQPLAFLSPEAKAALGNRFGRMASNCRAWRSPRLPSGCASPGSPATPSCGPTGFATISTRRRVWRTARLCCSATAS